MSDIHTNTDTDADKYILNGVEVTPNEVIQIITIFLQKQQFRVGRLTARIAEFEAAQRWIPVGERLPDTKIVYDEFDVIVELVDIVNGEMIRRVDLLFYDYRNKSWNDDCGEFGFYPVTGITHWRERPTPPEVQA